MFGQTKENKILENFHGRQRGKTPGGRKLAQEEPAGRESVGRKTAGKELAGRNLTGEESEGRKPVRSKLIRKGPSGEGPVGRATARRSGTLGKISRGKIPENRTCGENTSGPGQKATVMQGGKTGKAQQTENGAGILGRVLKNAGKKTGRLRLMQWNSVVTVHSLEPAKLAGNALLWGMARMVRGNNRRTR